MSETEAQVTVLKVHQLISARDVTTSRRYLFIYDDPDLGRTAVELTTGCLRWHGDKLDAVGVPGYRVDGGWMEQLNSRNIVAVLELPLETT